MATERTSITPFGSVVHFDANRDSMLPDGSVVSEQLLTSPSTFQAAWAEGSNFLIGYNMKKNVAGQTIGAQMITASDGSVFTGSVTAIVTIDGGTQAGGGSAVHEGNGYHSYAITQGETNGDHIAVTFTGTGAIASTVETYTAFPQTVDNDTKLTTLIARIIGTLESGSHNPASTAQLATLTDWINGGRLDLIQDIIAADVVNIDGASMRGTDSAALASVCTEVRLAELNAANMPADIDAIPTTAMRGTDSALLAANINLTGGAVDTVTTVTNQVSVSDILTTQMTESYSPDGTAPTLAQALFLIQQSIGDFSIAGTTITTKKIDGSTTAATYTLDDGTDPTSRTRAS